MSNGTPLALSDATLGTLRDAALWHTTAPQAAGWHMHCLNSNPCNCESPTHSAHLHEEAEHGEHGEAAVLDLLHLQLSQGVGVVSQTQGAAAHWWRGGRKMVRRR